LASFFDIYSLTNYSARIVARKLLRRRYTRDAAAVTDEYAAARQRYLDQWRRSPPPLDQFLISEADDDVGDQYHQVVDGRLVTGALRDVRARLIQRIIDAMTLYRPDSVIEFGCGTGRNLMAIKRSFPNTRCIGLELTAPSVELANTASAHYGVPVEARVADVTKPLQIDPVDVCFSMHALEQIPDSSRVLETMHSLAKKAVVLFEPIVERYPRTIRGAAARLRAYHLDRLRGLWPAIKNYNVTRVELLPHASNALNPTVEVHLARD
jgi:ubiquinone/menaquinone biosynthesis C-methylase UbiE